MKIFKIGKRILIGVVILTVGLFCAYRIGSIDDEGIIHYTDKRYQEDFSDELSDIIDKSNRGMIAIADESLEENSFSSNEEKNQSTSKDANANLISSGSEEQPTFVDNEVKEPVNNNTTLENPKDTFPPTEPKNNVKTTTKAIITKPKNQPTTSISSRSTSTTVKTTKRTTTLPPSTTKSNVNSNTSKEEVGKYNSENAKIIRDSMNEYRKELNLKSLQYDPTMQNYADIRAKEISILFGHTRPNGESSIPGPGRKYHGEILLYGGSRVARAVPAWKNSPQHNAIMIDPKYTRFAVAEYTVKTSKGTQIYRVALFA